MSTAYSLESLLARGYFPRELPPTFTTETYASHVAGVAASALPVLFEEGRSARLSFHNLARVGTLRRRLALANPVCQYGLAKAIVDNWADLDNHIGMSEITRSRPVADPNGRRGLVPSSPFGTRPWLRSEVRATARYAVLTDISQFYPSVYTHSIPWALHGKTKAKSRRQDKSLLGNVLDTLVRRAQDDQTVGLPIGPDSSLVLVETILAPVDKLLRQRLGNDVLVYRRVDDYEFGVPTLAAAEDAIATLQHLLADFELTLNPRKTKTLELPQPLEAEWAESLREFRFRDTPGKQKSDLIRYFDLAFREAQRHPDEAVIKFAVARFRSPATKVAPENWDSFQQLMVHSMTVTPGVASEILSELVRYERSGYVLNKPLVERWVNLQVRRHAPLGHGNEVVWALWAALAFDIRLDQKATDVLQSMGDSAVAVSALDANARGLLHADFQPKLWEQYLTGDGLYGEHWLLSYEANVHGWLPSPSGSDHVANDPAFGYLKSSGVKFYEPVSREPAPPSIEVVLFSGKEDLAGSAEEPFIEAAPSEDFYAY